MSDRYSVVCDLSLHNFDDPRAGHIEACEAFAEVRRLGEFDGRVRSTRMRRCEPLTVEISWKVDAATPREAFDVCSVILRSSIHAIGGSTARWELLRPRIQPMAGRRRRGRRSVAASNRPSEISPGWATLSAAAQRRMALVPALPPLVTPEPDDLLIDLR